MWKKALLLAVVTSSILIGSGCQHTREIRYVDRPLPLPARPVLPRISEEEAQSIPDDVWAKIVRRDLGRKHYAETLEAIILSTRPVTDTE